jgi:hypothetical protein
MNDRDIRLTRIPRSLYEGFPSIAGHPMGKQLTDVFPEGIYALHSGDLVLEVAPRITQRMLDACQRTPPRHTPSTLGL